MIVYLKNKWTPYNCIICLTPIDKLKYRSCKGGWLDRYFYIDDYDYCSPKCVDVVSEGIYTTGAITRETLDLIQKNTGRKRK